MKKILMVVLSCILMSLAAPAQQSNDGNSNTLQAFTRTIELDGIKWYFVHLNNRTVEVLFAAPTKYSMRARAAQKTLLYVQGTPEKEMSIDRKFFIEQGNEKLEAVPHNIKNFTGGKVSKGERIDGLLEFSKKIDVTQPFTIRAADKSVEVRLSPEALDMLQN